MNMHSFELKIVIEAAAGKIFAALTDPRWMAKWDPARWIVCDAHCGGRIRKRDEEDSLAEGEIVVYEPPMRFSYLWPVPTDPDEPEEDVFLVRYEFASEMHGKKSVLTMTATGFPTEELAEREKNSWGGYYLEKIKKVAESMPEDEHAQLDPAKRPVRSGVGATAE